MSAEGQNPAAEFPDVEKVKQLNKVQADGFWQWFWHRAVLPIALFTLTSLALALCMLYAPTFLLAICVFSACTCAWVPIMNFPLWVGIGLLMWQGWQVSSGRFSLVWE